MTTCTLTEAVSLAASSEGGSGRLAVQIITPGWGSSGFYSPEVLEAAAAARVFPAGTQMYLDHPSESERYDRPERSVKDLAAVLTEDARWDGDALVAPVQVFGPYRDVISEMRDAIGVSIRASAEVTEGEAEGRRGTIVTQLVEGVSVDFVTRAGRGGRILQVLESARGEVREARSIGQWVESRIHRDFTILADDMAGEGRLTREERIILSGGIGDALAAFVARVEADAPQLYRRDLWDEPTDSGADVAEARVVRVRLTHDISGFVAAMEAARRLTEATANDRREQLDAAVRDAHATGEGEYVWLRDYDEDRGVLWFERGGGDVNGTFEQAYTVADDDATVTLTGDPVEVAVRTQYVPVDPAGQSTTTHESRGGTIMPQIEEARLRQLEADAGRVTTLESERDTATRERDEARRALAEANARTAAAARARTRIGEANADLAPATVDRIVAAATATVPLAESGQLDEAAFDQAVDAARTAEEAYLATLAEASGAGRVRGFGGDTTSGAVTEADATTAVAGAFGRQTVKGA